MTEDVEVTSELMCHIRHMRAAKLCSAGGRAWCLANDISWDEFITIGISAKRLRETGDPLVLRMVIVAEREAGI